jgi:hypothetical protein
MILDCALVAASNEHEMLYAGFPGFVEHVLDQRPIDNREHLLRHGLGGRKDAGAEAGNRKNGFADFHIDSVGCFAGGMIRSVGTLLAGFAAGNKDGYVVAAGGPSGEGALTLKRVAVPSAHEPIRSKPRPTVPNRQEKRPAVKPMETVTGPPEIRILIKYRSDKGPEWLRL